MGEALATAEIESPLGTLRVAATDDGVVRIAFPGGSGGGFSAWLKQAFPAANRVDGLPMLEQARAEIKGYFDGSRTRFDVPVDLRGTDFQCSVWRLLLAIPYGETRSYAEVAESVARPRAFRAVGLASGANPVPLIVPCHRVIAADGKLGGFGGGLDAKRKLLAFEQGYVSNGRLL
jgi:methylated-DNA-[protein]-cysteine S-methyltransferase